MFKCLVLIACAGALVVLVVQPFGLSAETTWRVGSSCAALFGGATCWWALNRYTKAGHSAWKDKKVRYAVAVSIIGIGRFIMNAAVPTETIGAIHIAGLFLALVVAGYLFLLPTFLIDTDENAA